MSENATWVDALTQAVCPQCDWQYLAPLAVSPRRCPHCGQADLHTLEDERHNLPRVRPPELLLPFSAERTAIERAVTRFAAGIPYPPEDLNTAALLHRLDPLYLPMWLVDIDVTAQWQGEVGFDYQVVSYQEQFANGQWRQKKVEETRIRWEPRLGALQRRYENTATPALAHFGQLTERLGSFNLAAALPADDFPKDPIYRLPDRTPRDAWPDALPLLQQRAAEECRQAAAADHVRDFRWQASYSRQHWTQMLLPLYTTWYEDDEGTPQMVLIHGQTGRLVGQPRASMKRAQKRTVLIAILALVVGVLGIAAAVAGIFIPPLLVAAFPLLLAALLIGCGALVPIYRAWRFNDREKPQPLLF